jgi:hypothetical protein
MIQPLIPPFSSESDRRVHNMSPNAGPSPMRDLTPKQTHFAELVAGGEKLVVAYRMAYNASKMDQSSVRVESSRLAALPHVNATIERSRANSED